MFRVSLSCSGSVQMNSSMTLIQGNRCIEREKKNIFKNEREVKRLKEYALALIKIAWKSYFVKEHSDLKSKYNNEDIISLIEILVDNIFVVFAGKVFQQLIGIPMGTTCAPLLADIFLYSYKAEFIQSLLPTGMIRLASQFNFTYRYIDDVLSVNNPDFENYLGQMYRHELEIKDKTESNTSASYLDLLLLIDRDGKLHTSHYDKRVDFHFHITNFPFSSSNIPYSPAYGIFISQFIRYARACFSYECFILRAVRLSNKLLGQGYVKFEIVSKEVLWSVRGSYQTIWGPHHPNVTRHSGWWQCTVTPSIDQALYKFLTLLLILTLLPNLTFYLIVRGFLRTFATDAACQQRTLLLRTPGPVPLWDLQVF